MHIELLAGRRGRRLRVVPVVAGRSPPCRRCPTATTPRRATLFDAAGNAGDGDARRSGSTPPRRRSTSAGVRASYTRGEAAGARLRLRGRAARRRRLRRAARSTPRRLGEHVLTVTARDRLGNASTATVRYTVSRRPWPTVRKAAAALKITQGHAPRADAHGQGHRGEGRDRQGHGHRGRRAKKRVKLARGAWTATLKLKRRAEVDASPPRTPATRPRRDGEEDRQVAHQSRGDSGASGTGPRVRGAAHRTAFASTRLMSGWW